MEGGKERERGGGWREGKRERGGGEGWKEVEREGERKGGMEGGK